MPSCNTSMVSGQRSAQKASSRGQAAQAMVNNFMMADDPSPGKEAQNRTFFGKQDVEIESGYPSESDAMPSAQKQQQAALYDNGADNESRISYAMLPKTPKPPQDARFRIFHSMGF